MAWAGNLEDLPLPDLIRFYCGRRQTVRLTLSYPDGEAQLYFKDGALWDAVFGRLRGAGSYASRVRYSRPERMQGDVAWSLNGEHQHERGAASPVVPRPSTRTTSARCASSSPTSPRE